MIKKLFPIIFFIFISFIFFKPFFFEGKLPIPADTIVGLYYPFRDIYFDTNPNGIPFKNFLITDPVRQTYPWRQLAVKAWKSLEIPIWNPYNFAGTPLLANFQSAAFYPFNLLFFILPFVTAWNLIIFMSPMLGGVFLFYYLNNLKLKKEASLLGAIAFSFSGFFIAWLEYGTVVHTALWLPLILLSIDKMLENTKTKIWYLIFVFALVCASFAGHLQILFYLIIFAILYLSLKIYKNWNKNKKQVLTLITLFFTTAIITSIQWIPTLQFINLSARNVDLAGYLQTGWFIPWQNLIQFIAPDFFGNPSTLNYYGTWNYEEMVGFIGIFPLLMAFYSIIRKDKKTFFFLGTLLISLIFSLPNIISLIPFKLGIPLFSTAQPTRLLFISDFSLSVLAALGLDYLLRVKNKKNVLIPLAVIFLVFVFLWLFVFLYRGNLVSSENLHVSLQNLILPSIIFLIIAFTLFVYILFKQNTILSKYAIYILITLTFLELFRFGLKFESFSDKKYLFPDTKVTKFLESQPGVFRVISTDRTIFPPNFSIMYKIQTLDGYDPLYLLRYGELMAAAGRGVADISTPFGFNRIITPEFIFSPIIDLLNVKYILSTNDLKGSKLSQVYSDGITKVYLNNLYLDRAFFVEKTLVESSKQDAINALFDFDRALLMEKTLSKSSKQYPINVLFNSSDQFKKTAVVEQISNKSLFKNSWKIGKVIIEKYSENKIILNTSNEGDGFLVLTDSYYPTWHATVDGKETKIYLTDFNFRGIIVPGGKHIVEFYDTLF